MTIAGGAAPIRRAWSSSTRPAGTGRTPRQSSRGFDGTLQLDGYQGYNRLTRPSRKGGAPIGVAHCWAHARRKLKEVFDRDGSEIAAEGLRRIAEFYAVEADLRGLDPGQRLSARQARAAPLVAAFGDWLQESRPARFRQVPPGREARLHPPPLGRPADFPPRRTRRDRLQRRRDCQSASPDYRRPILTCS